MGKCYIIKSSVISQIAYAMKMKTIPEHFMSDINNFFDNFMRKNGKKKKNRQKRLMYPSQGARWPGIDRCLDFVKGEESHVGDRYLKAYSKTAGADWVPVSSKYMKMYGHDPGHTPWCTPGL